MRRLLLIGISAAAMLSFAMLLGLLILIEAAQIPMTVRNLGFFALGALALAALLVSLGQSAVDRLLFGDEEAEVTILHGEHK